VPQYPLSLSIDSAAYQPYLQPFTKFSSKNPSKIACQAPKPHNSLSAKDMRLACYPISSGIIKTREKKKALNVPTLRALPFKSRLYERPPIE
jgi:hypothetical protein